MILQKKSQGKLKTFHNCRYLRYATNHKELQGYLQWQMVGSSLLQERLQSSTPQNIFTERHKTVFARLQLQEKMIFFYF